MREVDELRKLYGDNWEFDKIGNYWKDKIGKLEERSTKEREELHKAEDIVFERLKELEEVKGEFTKEEEIIIKKEKFIKETEEARAQLRKEDLEREKKFEENRKEYEIEYNLIGKLTVLEDERDELKERQAKQKI